MFFEGGRPVLHRAGDDRAGLAGQDDRAASPVPVSLPGQQGGRSHSDLGQRVRPGLSAGRQGPGYQSPQDQDGRQGGGDGPPLQTDGVLLQGEGWCHDTS